MLFYPPHPLHDLIYSLHLNKNERRHWMWPKAEQTWAIHLWSQFKFKWKWIMFSCDSPGFISQWISCNYVQNCILACITCYFSSILCILCTMHEIPEWHLPKWALLCLSVFHFQHNKLPFLFKGWLKEIRSSHKNENPVIIYSPSSCSKPVWVSFFCWAQNKLVWRMLVTRQLTVAIDFSSMEKKYYWSQWLPSIV